MLDTPPLATFPAGTFCQNNKIGVLKEFVAKSASDADTAAALDGCEAFCEKTAACNACSVDSVPPSLQWAVQ